MNTDLILDLDRNRARLAAAFAADPAALDRPYAPGKWTGRQMLFHIVDCESAFLDRLKRALADAKPLLWALDPDRWNARLTPPERSLMVARDLQLAQRAAICELLCTVTDAEWERTAVHSEAGMLTVATIGHKVVSHASHHLDQVEAAIQGRIWTP